MPDLRGRFEPELMDAWILAFLVSYLVCNPFGWASVLIALFLVIIVSVLSW